MTPRAARLGRRRRAAPHAGHRTTPHRSPPHIITTLTLTTSPLLRPFAPAVPLSIGPTFGKDYAGEDYNVTMWHSGKDKAADNYKASTHPRRVYPTRTTPRRAAPRRTAVTRHRSARPAIPRWIITN